MFFFINVIITFVLGLAEGMLGGSGVVTNLYSLAVLIPSIAAGVRRMHDTGRSGWWLIVPIINLVFLAQDSQPEENRFGNNPRHVIEKNFITNEKQRNVLYIWLSCVAVILFIHNPIEGYVDAYGNRNGRIELTHKDSENYLNIPEEYCITTKEVDMNSVKINRHFGHPPDETYKTVCNIPAIHLYSKGLLKIRVTESLPC